MFPIIQIGFLKILTFQVIVCVGFYLCYGYLLVARPYGWIYHREYIKTAVWSLVAGAMGGKLLSAVTLYLQDRSQSFFHHLFYSGSVFYGILLAGFGMAYLLSRKYEIDFPRFASQIGEVLPLGQAIGRIGCFMNGCCYGREWNHWGGIWYPLEEGRVRVFPTWFAESVFCLGLFLYFRKRRFRESRESYLIYFISYGIFRFMIEFFRGDEIRGVYKFLSTSQIISLGVVIIAGGYFIYTKIRREKKGMEK